MKAYLEGGNCLAVRKIVFGYIFRESVDKVPYKTEGVHFILNNFFTTELLYPVDLKIRFIRRMKKDYNPDFIEEVLYINETLLLITFNYSFILLQRE